MATYSSTPKNIASPPGVNEGIAMFIRLGKYTFPPFSTALQVKDMRGHLGIWSIPLIHGFNIGPKVTEIYSPRYQPASEAKDKIYHYTGFVEGKPTCSLSLSLSGNRARLDDIATLPSAQRKGYATQLIYTALRVAQHRNAYYCFLYASPIGLNLYKRIGFQPLYIQRYYHSPSLKPF